MNFGALSTGPDTCLGAFFVYGTGRNDTGGPIWVIGTAFLKNVYTVLRSQPTAVGFAELNANPGQSSGEFRSPSSFFRWETYPSSTDERGRECKWYQR